MTLGWRKRSWGKWVCFSAHGVKQWLSVTAGSKSNQDSVSSKWNQFFSFQNPFACLPCIEKRLFKMLWGRLWSERGDQFRISDSQDNEENTAEGLVGGDLNTGDGLGCKIEERAAKKNPGKYALSVRTQIAQLLDCCGIDIVEITRNEKRSYRKREMEQ